MNVIKRSMDCQHGVEPLSFFCDVLGADPGTDWMSFATSIDEDDFKPILCNPVEFAHALEKGNMFAGKNLYFSGALLDGIGIATRNCISVKAIIADVDYGTIGHKKDSPFMTELEALEHVSNIGFKASMTYNTGHGIVVIFLLGKTVYFSDSDNADLFDDAKSRVYCAVKGDSTTSRQHYFRYPCSLNMKPGCPPVTGYVIQPLDQSIRYSPQEIIAALPPAPSGRSAKTGSKKKTVATKVVMPDVTFGDIDSPDKLDIPPALQQILSAKHPEGTRSDEFFKAVLGLYECGATLECIKQVLACNQSLVNKYSGRLDTEILRCVSKAYEPDDIVPLVPSCRIIDMPLED